MTAGFILVIAILVLGGVIATVSDRLGTKVGKARLSLFKLRPRSTAVVVTMVTGTVLSGMTLGILFAASKPLRRGVFRIDEIQERLNQSRKDLTRTEDEKERVEAELEQARNTLNSALAQLNQINSSLDQANTQTTETETKLQQTQSQLKKSQDRLNQLQSQLSEIDEAKNQTESELNRTESKLQEVFQQKQSLQSEIEQLQTDREKLIQQREQVKAQIKDRDREIAEQDQVISERDQVIAKRDQVIVEREKLLKDLEQQQAELEQQQAYLKDQFKLVERDFQLLREGSVVLKRGAVLASGLIRVKDPKKSTEVVNSLLQEANRNALSSVQMGNSSIAKEQVLQITKAEVEELIQEIDDGQDYVVQIISAANYLAGESQVAVFTKAEQNRLLFTSGEVIAGTSLKPSTLSNDQLQQQLEQLLDASRFRARFVGVLGVDGLIQIGDARVETLVSFFEQLQQHDQQVELQAVAAEDTYTIGPLKIDLLARRNGEIIVSTRPQDQEVITQEETETQQWQTEEIKPEDIETEGSPFIIDRTHSLTEND
ncbi:DUF3084 domain-containing protein [Lyngbya sp. PCC 8106]|uniref:DUF3084 domain-containing protein n=1 Tax=Lyngbya sp. (strain PCC 8106) TaxID=313612 RepID=UPI0000EAC788|nr:DUF3084 domain-containing protein [Lyngbya sp. PCC 8106]EAW38676.1 hypothetical protein L8106_14715 [Lyngbya sp. PCC 8106]